MSDAPAPADAPSPPPSAPRRRRSGWGRRVTMTLAVIALILLVLAAVLYLNRRAATREVLVGWLERQGIEAEMQVERVELDGLTARIRIGDPKNPDVVIERAEVDYAIGWPWSKQGIGLTPSRIRLIHPVVRASFRDGELSFGSLDPLIEKFTGQPPKPDSRSPLVLVERGRINLDTDFGRAVVVGDARVDNGKLMRLIARMPESDFKSGDLSASDLAADIDVTTTGDRVALTLNARAARLGSPQAQSDGARLSLAGNLPYPDLKNRRNDGPARLVLTLDANRLAAGGTTLNNADLDGRIETATTGWIDRFTLNGTSDWRLRAGRVSGATPASNVDLHLIQARTGIARNAEGLRWSVTGPARVASSSFAAGDARMTGLLANAASLSVSGQDETLQASGPLGFSVAGFIFDQLRLTDARGAGRLEVLAGPTLSVRFDGGVSRARGGWPLFGPVTRDDVPELAEMKRALSDFVLAAPGVQISVADAGTRVDLTRPVVITPANGGALTLTATSPVFASSGAAAGGSNLRLVATRGRGLPQADFAIPAWRLTPTGFTAQLDGDAALDFGLARGLKLETAGRLTSDAGRLTYVAAGCSPVTVERLELDESDVTDISTALCPADRPLADVRNGGWRADGRLAGLDASAPFLALNIQDADGAFTATGTARGIGLDARVARASVVDATTPARFNPLIAAGTARLAGDRWSGGFELSRGETALARLDLHHDGLSGLGGLDVSTRDIQFTDGGLQPRDLSALAGEFIGSPATGSVQFNGQIAWQPDAEGTSSGRLTVPNLNFTSAAGPVEGLSGIIDFTSLAPLVTAPGQQLRIAKLDTVADLTDLDMVFSLDKAALMLDGGTVRAAGGTITIEPLRVPLDRTQPVQGVITFDRVQLGDVLAGAGFADKVLVDAVVSGRLPFVYDPVNGVRVTGGTLAAAQPGRLSIKPEALSGLEAGGGGEDVPPNMVQDLAYQAMENLAFDVLTADLNSLDGGRLSVLFHIKGRHDPPIRQELRLTWLELVRRDFLNKELPLPSGTEIDLTLDTNVNINQIISDLLAINRARAGQPDAAPVPAPAAETP